MNIILPLSITLAFETGIYMILKHRNIKLFIVVSLLNLFLNPVMNLSLSSIENDAVYAIVLWASEIATILIEALIICLICKLKFTKVLLFSLIANATSFIIGVLIFPLYETKIAAIVVSSLFFLVYLFTFAFLSFVVIHNYHNRNCNRRNNKEE